MPGVLQVEAMAQTGGLLVLAKLDEPERYSTYFLKIDNVKFRHKVVPGDTILFRVELTSEMRRGLSSVTRWYPKPISLRRSSKTNRII